MKQHLDLCIFDLFEMHNMLHYKKMMMEWDGVGVEVEVVPIYVISDICEKNE